MSDQPFVGEICIVPFNFAPKGWATCDGQLLPLSQNTALFSILGTTYGGDGASNFALPNLNGRAPMHPEWGPGLSGHYLGEAGGSETVTLLESEIPAHNHRIKYGTSSGQVTDPEQALPGRTAGRRGGLLYGPPSGGGVMSPGMIAVAGGSLPHSNMQPYLTMNFIIALQGIYPPRP